MIKTLRDMADILDNLSAELDLNNLTFPEMGDFEILTSSGEPIIKLEEYEVYRTLHSSSSGVISTIVLRHKTSGRMYRMFEYT